MKILTLFSFFVLFAGGALSQKPITPLLATENMPVLKFRNEIKVGGFGEYIVAKRFFDDEDRLVTVTNFGIQYWNSKTVELVKSVPHEILNLEKFDTLIVISPDGSKMIVTDAFNFSLKKLLGKKANLPAMVYSLETGKQLAVLQRPENSIRRGVWSRDGKTLVTFSNSFGEGYNTEISFWDGETLEFRGSISANKWNYLTRDGEKFITTSGITKNTFGYKFEKPNSINIWNTQTGKIDKTFSLTNEKSLKHIRITGDEKFLLAENDKRIILLNLENGVQQNFSAKDSTSIDGAQLSNDKHFLAAENNGKILVWETSGNGLPKFEITPPTPVGKEKLTTDLLGFSNDSKHVAISQLKYKKVLLVLSVPTPIDTEFYDLQTSQLNPNLSLFINNLTSISSADRRFAVVRDCSGAQMFDIEKQQKLFSFPLNCKSGEISSYENGETKTETYYYNDDIIAFHPKKNVSLVVKDDVLEIYGVNPDKKRLQIIDAPRSLSKKFTRTPFSNGSLADLFSTIENTVDSLDPELDTVTAGFLRDGEVVFATSADLRSVFFWDVDKNLIE
ncbi:MAG: hypothetical protein ABJA66_21990 [Actinomycetota bacterium]